MCAFFPTSRADFDSGWLGHKAVVKPEALEQNLRAVFSSLMGMNKPQSEMYVGGNFGGGNMCLGHWPESGQTSSKQSNSTARKQKQKFTKFFLKKFENFRAWMIRHDFFQS